MTDPYDYRCLNCGTGLLDDAPYCNNRCETAHAQRALRRALRRVLILAHLKQRFARVVGHDVVDDER